ncbi:MAG: T9SS type A sorting domain-containing protein [Bacteroidetes bacterium]|nr:T9SS type A sorting domain-containing protein [Bacteroidota bacterium]
MKKIYLLTFTLFALSHLKAQTPLTLTQSNSEPIVGDSYGSMLVDTNSTPLPITISGTGVTWDILGLTYTDSLIATNTYSTPASNANSANYPGTTLVLTDSTVTTYYKSSTNKLELLGVDAGFFDLNYNTNAANIANYPVTYGYTDTDVLVGGTMNVPQFSLSGPFTGTVITTADGTGTANFNGITSLSNCLRLKTIQHLNFSLAGGLITGTIDQNIYNFYHSSSKFPVFTISYSHIVASGLQSLDQVQNQVNILSNVSIGVKENKLNDIIFKAYPNPANDQLNLHFVLAKSESYTVEISNTLGQVVKTIAMPDLQAGMYNQAINTSDLGAGIYTIKVNGKNTQGTEKLVIQK